MFVLPCPFSVVVGLFLDRHWPSEVEAVCSQDDTVDCLMVVELAIVVVVLIQRPFQIK